MGNINSTVNVSYANGAVTVTASDVDLPATSQGAQNIVFALSVAADVPNGPYKFPDDGDASHPNNGISITSPGSEFSNYNKLGNGNVQVRDSNDNTNSYPYTVTVLDKNGNAFVSDPAIRNGGTN